MATTVFLNEFHYDNAGNDQGEGFEIAAPAGTDLTGWTLVLYNGGSTAVSAANATVYGTIALSGTVADQGNGFGTRSFAPAQDGLQNGSPDGFALINASGQVVQFLSYEGVLTAAAGTPAATGRPSIDVGVVEGTTTPSIEGFRSIAEGDDGTTQLTLIVTRANGSSGAVRASYEIQFTGATADDLADGQTLTGSVAFADGQTSATILIGIRGDRIVEADERFYVQISAPTCGVTIGGDATGTASSEVIITNDDSAAVAGRAFVNEILYDPSGTDTGERVEIAGTAGLNLAGWTLVLYNGNGGAPYSTIALSGVIPDQDDATARCPLRRSVSRTARLTGSRWSMRTVRWCSSRRTRAASPRSAARPMG